MRADAERDEYYMKTALDLARNGKECSPNPRVGCVIVRGGEIIGRGWHAVCGEAHAEVNAVNDARGDIEGADVYVTLEPCSHFGRTPPCADMLIRRKPRRVAVGTTDPNPRVSGKGIAKLKEAGIEVTTGVLEKECKRLNRGFIRRMTEGRPWVTIKSAASLDGIIALANGQSKWITGSAARAEVHRMRAKSDAVLTGVGTVTADDPRFTVRLTPGRSPFVAVLDRNLRTPRTANVARAGNVIFCLEGASDESAAFFEGAGVRVVRLPRENFLKEAMSELSRMGVNYLMAEAGSAVVSSLIREKLCDELALFIAPKIFGRGLSFAGDLEVDDIDCAPRLRDVKYKEFGGDLLIRGVFECSPDL